MIIKDDRIDNGKPFDWGRTSNDYAKYRDIYPPEFYRKILELGLCRQGQKVLDLGTGTGVLPRNLYDYGAEWTAADISPEQIKEAVRLSEQNNMDIRYFASSAEELDFPPENFDLITACQCFWYFDHKTIAPKLNKWLRPDGKLLILYMAWLPHEDTIAGASERLVLKYSPKWTGAGETVHPIGIPDAITEYFIPVGHEEFYLDVPFTKESWHGRMKACRGVGASLSRPELLNWEKEHLDMLKNIPQNTFTIKHYAAYALLKKK